MLFDVSENTAVPIDTKNIELIYDAGRLGSAQLMATLTDMFRVPIAVIYNNKAIHADNGLPGTKLINGAIQNSQLNPCDIGSDILTVGMYNLTVCHIPFYHQGQTEFLAVMSKSRMFLKEMQNLFKLLKEFCSKDNNAATDRERTYHKYISNFLSGRITQEKIRSFEAFRGSENVYSGLILIDSANPQQVYTLILEVLESPRISKIGKVNAHIMDDIKGREAAIFFELYTGGNADDIGIWQQMFIEEMERSMTGINDSFIAVGRLYKRLEDIIRSYREAREAYETGRVL